MEMEKQLQKIKKRLDNDDPGMMQAGIHDACRNIISDATVTFEHGGVVTETAKAKLMRVFNGQEIWIPKSLISDESSSTITIPEWFADKLERDFYGEDPRIPDEFAYEDGR